MYENDVKDIGCHMPLSNSGQVMIASTLIIRQENVPEKLRRDFYTLDKEKVWSA